LHFGSSGVEQDGASFTRMTHLTGTMQDDIIAVTLWSLIGHLTLFLVEWPLIVCVTHKSLGRVRFEVVLTQTYL
jgi:hypothetical protein